jgi:hypothetical protein
MVTVASDNPYPSVLFVETVDPSTPAAGTQRLFVDTDGILKLIDDAAVVTEISSIVGVTAHLADTTDAHDASAISFSPTGTIAATDVQAAIAEVASEATANLAGVELDYVAFTSPVSVTATAEASATTIVTGSAVVYDGSTVAVIELVVPDVDMGGQNVGDLTIVWLYDGSSSIGFAAVLRNPLTGANALRQPIHIAHRLTPSAATHTYSWRGTVTNASRPASIAAGAGGAGARLPGYIRITRV